MIVPLAGLITGSVSKGHRRIGDFAANTLVVDKKHVGRPVRLSGVNDIAEPTRPVPGLWDPPVPAPSEQPRVTEPTASAPTAERPDTSPAVETSAAVEPNADDTSEPAPAQYDYYQAEGNQPGVDAPMWDEARDAYIQWDPELEAWMEWSESSGRWIPISQ